MIHMRSECVDEKREGRDEYGISIETRRRETKRREGSSINWGVLKIKDKD